MNRKKLTPVAVGLFLTLISLGIIIGLISKSLFSSIRNLSVNPSINPRNTLTSGRFTKLWEQPITSYPTVFSENRIPTELFLALHQNSVLLIETSFERNRFSTTTYLTSINLGNGQQNWQRKLDLVDKICCAFKNSNYVYIPYEYSAISGMVPSSCNYQSWSRKCDRIFISALNPLTGEQAWGFYYEGMNRINKLEFNDSYISLKGIGARELYQSQFSIDALTGKRLDRYKDITNLESDVAQDVFMKLGINISADIVGNIVEHDGIVFFLTRDAKLWAVDKESYKVLGTVHFDLGDFISFDSKHNGFGIAINKNIVVVYIGDSQQLFAFQFIPN